MPWNCLQFSLDGDGVATLTISRPERLNALNAACIGELGEAFEQVEADPAVRALILTGAGDKAFVAGADISELAGATPVNASRRSARGQAIFRKLEQLGKPSVAAINGFALGGGLELAMCCTIRVAVETAKLGQPEVKLGIIPGYGGTQRLPRLVGRGRAMELLLTGDAISAAEAHRIGLVNHVVSAAELLPLSHSILLKMLNHSPAAISLMMRAVDVGLDASIDEALQFESASFGVAAATEDCKEGVAAFLEKRPPKFTGK